MHWHVGNVNMEDEKEAMKKVRISINSIRPRHKFQTEMTME